MNIVLVEPEIPANTGNVARICAVTGSVLHLVGPLGFRLDDQKMKRAGLDYWNWLKWHQWPDWQTFLSQQAETAARFWFIESSGARHYAEVTYTANDFLIFGRETAGLPKALLERYPTQWLRIPMFHPEVRSLNLSNCVALVLYEALRQGGFAAECLPKATVT